MFDTVSLPRNTISCLIETVLEAGQEIMMIYIAHEKIQDYRIKSDASPVTDADERAEKIITRALLRLNPHIPIVAEESFSAGTRPKVGDGPFWLVDPLDGTKSFIRKEKDFTVNIALVINRQSVAGVVYSPAHDLLWYTDDQGRAYKHHTADSVPLPHTVSAPPLIVTQADQRWRVLASRDHETPEAQAYMARLPIKTRINRSSSLKLCLLAEGSADFYPRLGPTMEWDTAAGHAILTGAQGYVTHTNLTPFTYGKANFKSPSFFAIGGISLEKIPAL